MGQPYGVGKDGLGNLYVNHTSFGRTTVYLDANAISTNNEPADFTDSSFTGTATTTAGNLYSAIDDAARILLVTEAFSRRVSTWTASSALSVELDGVLGVSVGRLATAQLRPKGALLVVRWSGSGQLRQN